MPLYMDLHKVVKGIKIEDVENLHVLDVAVQDKYHVKYHKFFVNEAEGTIFCWLKRQVRKLVPHATKNPIVSWHVRSLKCTLQI